MLMKIIVYRYGSIAEPDIIRAFREHGFNVTEYSLEINSKSLSLTEYVRRFSEFLDANPSDMIFSINFYPFLSEIGRIYHIPYVSWTVDSPVMELYTSSITNPYNFTFIFDHEDYAELAPVNPGHIFYLPLAGNVAEKQDVISAQSDRDRERFSHRIAFVGSLYTEKCPYDKLPPDAPAYMRGYLDSLMAAQLLIYGDNFIERALNDNVVADFAKHHPSFYRLPESDGKKTYLTDRMTLARLYISNKIAATERVSFLKYLSEEMPTDIYTASDTSVIPKVKNRGLAKSLTEMPIIFADTAVNLNFTTRAIRSGLPLRIFDILSSGGFCLTNYQSELTSCFTPGVHLDYFSSRDELKEKCAYYLAHEKERKEIAAEGLSEVKKNHTWNVRVGQMFQMI